MWLKSGGGGLLENEVLVHVEHLFAVLAEGEESSGEEGNKPDGLPRAEEQPMLHLGKVVRENKKAKHIGDKDEAGVALERWIGTGERNLAEADEDAFNQESGAGDQDRGVKKSGGPSPEK